MTDASTSDADERIPCPDEMCTGVIGDDGRCGTCGRAADPNAPSPTPPAASAPTESQEPAVEALRADEAPVDADERVPCSDDMCTGILGPDGRCGTCGRAARQTS